MIYLIAVEYLVNCTCMYTKFEADSPGKNIQFSIKFNGFLMIRPYIFSSQHIALLKQKCLKWQMKYVHDSGLTIILSFETMHFIAESVEQDQPARTCSLVLLCTLICSITYFSLQDTFWNLYTCVIVIRLNSAK